MSLPPVTYTLSFDEYDALKQAAACLAALEQGVVISPRVYATISQAAEAALKVDARPQVAVHHLSDINRPAA